MVYWFSVLLCALAGNGTWVAYALATGAVFLVALCIARYARLSASPGSLYTYASMTLPPWLTATVAWSLLLAYVATGSSVIGGFYHYANLLLRDATGHVYSAVLLATLVTGVSIWIAYRDVKISARLMLWIEAASVTVIVIVVILLLVRHGWHLDAEQLHLHDMTRSGLRLGLALLTAGTADIFDASMPISVVLILLVTSISRTKTSGCPRSLKIDTGVFSANWAMPVSSSAEIPSRSTSNAIARYREPVSKYSILSLLASSFPTVLLPAPAGPSIVIVIFFSFLQLRSFRFVCLFLLIPYTLNAHNIFIGSSLHPFSP